MNKSDWSILQRQAPIGLILFSVDVFQKLIKGIWPFLLIVFFRGGNEDRDILYFWATIGGIAFIIINASLSYCFFKFQIYNNEFVVKKGYLKKVRLTVPLDRIQTINIKQNILQKLLNVVSLEIDTAGAQNTEIKLIAIKKNVAEELKEIFQSSIEKNKPILTSDKDVSGKRERLNVILKLKIIDLVKISLSENHIRNFFIVLGVFYGLFYQIRDVFEEEAERFAQDSYQVLESMNYKLYFGLAGFVLIFSVLISFIKVFLRFYNLKLIKVKDAFIIHFGLFSTKEVNVPMNKIQFISWHQNPLRNILNYQTLKIKQAVSSERIKKKQLIELPACGLAQQEEIEESIFGENSSVFSLAQKTHWIYFLKLFILWTSLIVFPSVFFLGAYIEYQISLIVVELIIMLLIYLSYKRRQVRLSKKLLEITKGSISKTIYRLQNYKIQSVCFRQNVFVKRRGLADIIIYTAAGENLLIPYISERLALDIYNFLLYEIEKTNKSWM